MQADITFIYEELIRQNYAISYSSVTDRFADAQAHLLAKCEAINNKINRTTGKSAKDLFEQEKLFIGISR